MTATAELETRVEPRGESSPCGDAAPMFDLMELLFFAYRDFVGDADQLLTTYGFGRAHHRTLFFIYRRPGLAIAELLDILRVTKQSLNRVLKELLDAGFVEVRPGTADRRQRRLFVTPSGEDLALRLAQVQSCRLAGALATLPPAARPQARAFLLGMIGLPDRPRIAANGGAAAHGLRLEAAR